MRECNKLLCETLVRLDINSEFLPLLLVGQRKVSTPCLLFDCKTFHFLRIHTLYLFTISHLHLTQLYLF